jgi:hypothetical protein
LIEAKDGNFFGSILTDFFPPPRKPEEFIFLGCVKVQENRCSVDETNSSFFFKKRERKKFPAKPGLPDGIFSNLKSLFG